MKFGLSYREFWEMDLDELNSFAEAKLQDDKDSLAKDYNLATMIASFVNCAIGGHDIPTMFEVFPSLFTQKEIDDYYEKRALEEFSRLATTKNAERATKK